MVKNLPTKCGGHCFNPWSEKIPHALKQLNPCTSYWACTSLQREKLPHWEGHAPQAPQLVSVFWKTREGPSFWMEISAGREERFCQCPLLSGALGWQLPATRLYSQEQGLRGLSQRATSQPASSHPPPHHDCLTTAVKTSLACTSELTLIQMWLEMEVSSVTSIHLLLLLCYTLIWTPF